MRHTGCVSSLSGNKSIHTFPSKETHFFSLCQISLLLLSYDISLRISWAPPTQEEQTLDQKDADTSQPDSETFARATLCSVKERLHDFQKDRLRGILHARNNLILSTAASGLITYAFLFLSIVSIPTQDVSESCNVALASAVTLYVIGVAAGLFGRLYAEA